MLLTTTSFGTGCVCVCVEQIRPVDNKLELWAYGSDGERLLPDLAVNPPVGLNM